MSLDSVYASLTHNHAGIYEPANSNIQTHITAASPHTGHLTDAPSDDKQYARKNAAWSEVAATGGGTWSTITGTLADQTDLQAALDAKAAAVHTHTTRQALLMHANNGTVAPGATLYLVPALQGFVSINVGAIPFNCTVKNLTVRTNSNQPNTGAMTVTVQREVLDTTLSLSIPINGPVNTYSNAIHARDIHSRAAPRSQVCKRGFCQQRSHYSRICRITTGHTLDPGRLNHPG